MEIKSGREVGPFKLGMRLEEVRSILDEPEVYEDWMGGNLNDSILIHGLILGFDLCDSHGPIRGAKLVYFDLRYREDAIIFKKDIREWSLESFTSYLRENELDYKIEHSDDVDVDINILDLELSVSFENNRFILAQSNA